MGIKKNAKVVLTENSCTVKGTNIALVELLSHVAKYFKDKGFDKKFVNKVVDMGYMEEEELAKNSQKLAKEIINEILDVAKKNANLD